jgi:hypothetical protein
MSEHITGPPAPPAPSATTESDTPAALHQQFGRCVDACLLTADGLLEQLGPEPPAPGEAASVALTHYGNSPAFRAWLVWSTIQQLGAAWHALQGASGDIIAQGRRGTTR